MGYSTDVERTSLAQAVVFKLQPILHRCNEFGFVLCADSLPKVFRPHIHGEEAILALLQYFLMIFPNWPAGPCPALFHVVAKH